jgi:hypothetical protein
VVNMSMSIHNSNEWDEERVKEELPSVKVKLIMEDRIVKGYVKGRKNRFATVRVRLDKDTYKDLHYAWGSVVHALNNGKPLLG